MTMLKNTQPNQRLQFHGSKASPLASTSSALKHPFEIIARIRDYPNGKNEQLMSIHHFNRQNHSIRVNQDSGYHDFTLDGISLSEKEDLGAFYSKFIQPKVVRVKLGDKCAVLMYGSIGSGRSETMFGSSKQPGIVYNSLRNIIGNDKEDGVQLSVLEIYKEEIFYLQSKGNSSNTKVRLEVMGQKAKNATFISRNEAGKIYKEIHKAMKRRIAKSVLCNDKDSQYHCTIFIDVPKVGGRLLLVDMAFPESKDQEGQIGSEVKMQEARINYRNMSFKRVVESIVNGDSHVPFRGSKLTLLLQDSFEDGNSNFLMILCGSLDPKVIHKMISTLEYEAKDKSIVRVPNSQVKDKIELEDSSSATFLGSRVTAMDEDNLKIKRGNKFGENEKNGSNKELLKKEANCVTACALRSERFDKNVSLTYDSKAPKSFGANGATTACNSAIGLGPKVGENSVKVLEVLEEKGIAKKGKGGWNAITYPSRLHEKIAFLEGKVKRIAINIKRTKAMLDKNNPYTSRVILLDIQNNISGIEKDIRHVVGGDDTKIEISKKEPYCDVQEVKMVENGPVGQVDKCKSSVKGLSEDLEARLFLHHMLLRKRLNSKASSKCSRGTESHVGEHGGELMEDLEVEKLLSTTDEKPKEMEFLASPSTEQPIVSGRDEQADPSYSEVQEMDVVPATNAQDAGNMTVKKDDSELDLASKEKLDDPDKENNKRTVSAKVIEDAAIYQMNIIGGRTSTGGWFVSEAESIFVHDDGSCTIHDIVNSEEKVVYRPPAGFARNLWRDCWIINASGSDYCAGKYVVAASAGNTTESGFCSWDYNTKEVQASHFESRATTPSSSTVISNKRKALSDILEPETRQWWYKPSGCLMVFGASCDKVVRFHDIRVGDSLMTLHLANPILTMDYSSPLQWRNTGRLVIAGTETISLWDVNSKPQPLHTISTSGQKVSALHINNTDVEQVCGVRRRLSSSQVEGMDGVFCTQDSVNILDFRRPTGLALRISDLELNVQSIFSNGDTILLGGMNSKSGCKRQPSFELQRLSLSMPMSCSSYPFPDFCSGYKEDAKIRQVWGDSKNIMGVTGLGLFVFDIWKVNELLSCTRGFGNTHLKCIVGPNDLYLPSFDCLDSRILLISRDRPAMWKFLS